MKPFDLSAQEPRRKRAQERLESQLEEVLEREGAVIIRPPTVLAGPAQRLPDSLADIIVVRDESQRQKSGKTYVLTVDFGPHEASPHVVRVDGLVAKPVRDIRPAFQSTMHKWQTPLAEGIDLTALVVRATDLVVEELDPRMFEEQFTPGTPDEAYRESRRGLWSRLRRPFIRWRRSGYEAPAAPAGAVNEPRVQSGADLQIEAMPSAEQDEAMSTELGEPASESFWARLRPSRNADVEPAALREAPVSAEEVSWEPPVLEPAIRSGRLVLVFLGLLCLVAVPAGAVSWSRSLTTSLQQSKTLLAASTKLEPGRALTLQDWSAQFARLQAFAQEVETSHGLAFSLAGLIPATRASSQSIEALLVMAKEGSEGARLLSLGLARFSEDEGIRPDERLARLQAYLEEAMPHLTRTFAAAHRIDPEVLPENVRAQVQGIQEQVLALEPIAGQADVLTRLLLSMIGHEASRTYLVLFQNQAELRPTGGFMGSYAEVVLDRGEIKKLNVPGGGPYDLRSQLRVRWQPPEPLRLVGGRWEFQDANWSPDFSQAASTIQTFWNQAGQPTLDGIIAVNATILPKLLELTGPIEMAAYGKTVTSENVILETQKAVELEYDREQNTPKAFVGDLNKEVIARLQALPASRLPEVLRIAAEALETKEIQLWFSREDEQNAARSFGWTGEWSSPDAFDSLALIGANIAGQKSDAVVREDVFQEVTIGEAGDVRERVLLAREHRGQPGTIFYGANNVQYLRIYAPKGTNFTGLEGTEEPDQKFFEEVTEKEVPFPAATITTRQTFSGGAWADVGEEAGRQVLGAWIQVRPGTVRETAVSYTIPRTTGDMARAFLDGETAIEGVTDAYVVRLQSQSGAARKHMVRVRYPSAWRITQLPTSAKPVSPGILEWKQDVLDRDQLFYVLFDRYATNASSSTTNE